MKYSARKIWHKNECALPTDSSPTKSLLTPVKNEFYLVCSVLVLHSTSSLSQNPKFWKNILFCYIMVLVHTYFMQPILKFT